MVRAFVETMEDVSQDCVESLQAVGASFPQRVSQAILPSCLSSFLSWFLYCVEVNIRASTIVGMVGGGGVGYVISNSLQGYDYGTAGVAILLVFLVAYFIERIFVRIKKKFY